jgi:hypothetical protein
MALPTIFDHTSYVVTLNAVALQDHVAECNYNLERPIQDYPTYGGMTSNPGVLKISGEIKVAVDETAASPHETLMGELLTPTSGGLALVLRPKGTGSGNFEITVNAVIGGANLGGAPSAIQEGVFPFTGTGAIARAAQV